MILKKQTLLLVSTLSLFCSQMAFADEVEDYPKRPIQLIIPSPAGNVNDAAARIIGEEISKDWSQPLVIINKPGASGIVGTQYVAKAKPDGYTALLTYTVHVQNPALYDDIPYEPIDDFEPVSQLAFSSTALVKNKDFKAQNLEEVIDYTKDNPGTFYGSYGNGTTGHIMGEHLNKTQDLEMKHVAYKGGAPLAQDLLSKQIDIGFIAVGSAMSFFKSGELVPLAISGDERSELLPDVPTFLEKGHEGFEPNAWMGILMPKSTNPEIVTKLSNKIAEVVQRESVIKKLNNLNLTPVGSSPNEFTDVLKSDLDKWTTIINDLDIKKE